MFNMIWQGKITALRAVGDVGENRIMTTIVTGAEDGLFGKDTVGPVARRVYDYVRKGKIGSVPIRTKDRYMCKVTLSYFDSADKPQKLETTRAILESVLLVASKDADIPPKVRLTISWEYTEKELVYLAHAFKRELSVEICGMQEALPFGQDNTDEAPKPIKRTGNGKHADDAPQPAL